MECTATDLTKAKVVLNTVVCMFAEYCSQPFQVEPVEVVNADGSREGGPRTAAPRLHNIWGLLLHLNSIDRKCPAFYIKRLIHPSVLHSGAFCSRVHQ